MNILLKIYFWSWYLRTSYYTITYIYATTCVICAALRDQKGNWTNGLRIYYNKDGRDSSCIARRRVFCNLHSHIIRYKLLWTPLFNTFIFYILTMRVFVVNILLSGNKNVFLRWRQGEEEKNSEKENKINFLHKSVYFQSRNGQHFIWSLTLDSSFSSPIWAAPSTLAAVWRIDNQHDDCGGQEGSGGWHWLTDCSHNCSQHFIGDRMRTERDCFEKINIPKQSVEEAQKADNGGL